MNAQAKIEATALARLRDPFADHHISKLPKETRKQIDERKTGKNMLWNCPICGGHHHKDAVHLDYVGHAALTDRLLDTDIEWSWEPVAFNAEGLPALDRNGGLWIRLTVCGVTRLGYGSADGKSGGDAIKEIIGDALRNAAMRFGAALDLWHKGDLHLDDEAGRGQSQSGAVSPDPADYTPLEPIVEDRPKKDYAFPDGPATGISQLKQMTRGLWREIAGCGDEDELLGLLEAPESKAILAQVEALENPTHRQLWEGDGKDNPGLRAFIENRKHELRPLNPLAAG